MVGEIHPTGRGFVCLVEQSRLEALVSYIEQRTGGYCVIGRHPQGDGKILLQVITYSLPPECIEMLQQEVADLIPLEGE